ncbi:glycosyltransferase family 4 protein [Mucilaginibacter sp. KACC 22063]|uniref:glycosyltransferase family 4 protein n=1 Tax=Mucilaginibacter sp. KACC 22063 TaxID=3025666 RepID=UPI0023661D6B|nr:glycosyltransferase family 4 protein [Mucilaginibacter sp. KACC 22063]WDF57138.1 glycosyltransferase family 4 protein [Mucilaginibacter sp. KACC 22063]
MEKHIYQLSKHQLHENDVTLLYNSGNKISAHDIRVLQSVNLSLIRPQFLGIIIFYIAATFKLLFRRQKYDVLHIHGDWSSLVFARMLKSITCAKAIVFSYHGQVTTGFAHTRLLPFFLRKVDLIFTTGYESAERIENLTKRKVIVQPSGINDLYFDPRDVTVNEKFTVITVAYLRKQKNIPLILDIAANLPGVDFNIAGEGEEQQHILNLIENNKLSNVKLLGAKSPQELTKIYRESHCFLLTSLAEGTPTSVLEAMACSLPIVASNAGGLKRVISNNINGYVIDSFDKELYMDAISKFKSDETFRLEVSKNNTILAQNYKWQQVASNITRKTAELLNDKA